MKLSGFNAVRPAKQTSEINTCTKGHIRFNIEISTISIIVMLMFIYGDASSGLYHNY